MGKTTRRANRLYIFFMILMADMKWPSYLSGLYSYLLSFTKRTQPLVDVDAAQIQVEEEFNRLWEEGKIDGWTSGPQTNGSGAVEGIWCPACSPLFLLFKPSTHAYRRPKVLCQTNRI